MSWCVDLHTERCIEETVHTNRYRPRSKESLKDTQCVAIVEAVPWNFFFLKKGSNKNQIMKEETKKKKKEERRSKKKKKEKEKDKEDVKI